MLAAFCALVSTSVNIHMIKKATRKQKKNVSHIHHMNTSFLQWYHLVSFLWIFKDFVAVYRLPHSTQIRPWLVIMWMLSVITAISFSPRFKGTFTCITCTTWDRDTITKTLHNDFMVMFLMEITILLWQPHQNSAAILQLRSTQIHDNHTTCQCYYVSCCVT